MKRRIEFCSKKRIVDEDDFCRRFRNQYDDKQWSRLVQDPLFEKALLAVDTENIQQIANSVLLGDYSDLKTAEEAYRSQVEQNKIRRRLNIPKGVS